MAEWLTKEHYDTYPLADPKCKICKLPVADLKKLHHMRFIDNVSFESINDYLKMNYEMSSSMTTLVQHFSRHTNEGEKMKLVKALDVSVASELQKLDLDKNGANAENLQTAYTHLTKTCMEMSESASKILAPYLEQLKAIPEDKIRERLEKSNNPLKTLEQMARIQKILSDNVHTISQMRAPKVVVAQFLDLAVNEVIKQTGYIFSEACQTVKLSILEELKDRGINVSEQVFKNAFSKSVNDFKNAMLTMKREQLSKAIEVLSEIEKIV